MTTDIEAIAACGARIAELEAALERPNHYYRQVMLQEKQRAERAEAERDALRTVLTPSQRKRFDAQWQPREECGR